MTNQATARAPSARRTRLTPAEREFLPAVVEIEDTPPSPVGRAILWSIVALFVLGAVWAWLGHIDIVAVAQGRIIPNDHSKIIQPLDSGVVAAIHVRDGQAVRAGDLLVELDGTASGAEVARLDNERLAAALQCARLRALAEGEQDLIAPPASADPALVAVQRRLLHDALARQRSELASAALVVEQRAAALEVTRAHIRRLQATIPLLEERAGALKAMLDERYASRSEYLAIEEARLDRINELAALRHQVVQDAAALGEAERRVEGLQAEQQQRHLSELADWQTRARSLAEELVKARDRSVRQRLLSPIDGVVQQLAVHTIGGVVTPAQELMVIVPAEDRLQIQAWLQNKDIGFVQAGQTAEIKVEAFPFTRFGTIAGQVRTVSSDAVPLENRGLVYAAEVSMERAVMDVGHKQVALSPGMNVSVEVKTGTRRLIEFLLSPLLRGLKEAARER